MAQDIHIAVALEYDGENAPKVSAKGEGALAQQIIAIARHHNVPLQENPELVRMLATLELGDQIPEVLYLAVAEIIAFAYIIRGKVPDNYKKPQADTSVADEMKNITNEEKNNDLR